MKLNDSEIKILFLIGQLEDKHSIYGVDFKTLYTSTNKCKSRVRQIILKLLKAALIYEAVKRGYEKTYKTTDLGKDFILMLKGDII